VTTVPLAVEENCRLFKTLVIVVFDPAENVTSEPVELFNVKGELAPVNVKLVAPDAAQVKQIHAAPVHWYNSGIRHVFAAKLDCPTVGAPTGATHPVFSSIP